MSILIAYNYTADEDITQGEALALSPSTSRFNDRRVVLADSEDKIVGVAMQSVSAGQAVALAAFVTGQSVKCLLGEDVSAGDKIWVGSDGVFVKNTDSSLIAMDAAASGELVEAVYNAADPSMGDVTINGDLTLDDDSVINWGDEELAAPSLSGEIGLNPGGVHLENIQGSNKAVYPVGSIAFLSIKAKTTLYAGGTISSANLPAYKPVNFSLSADGGTLLVNQIQAGYVLTGTWKILVGGTNAADDGVIVILAQCIDA